jgi:hypothetical protein
MGYDAGCTLRMDGHAEQGTAWLEHKDLVFRGPLRLVIPLKDITEARADGGTLHVRFGGTRAAFEIGPAAARWAKRITNPPSRLDKLGVKPGLRVVLVGVRDEELEQELAARHADVSRRVNANGADILFFAADTRADLSRLDGLSRAIAPDGALWVIRPKGRPDITEAETMAAGKKAGLVDVKVVSFSNTHTAEKFVVPRRARQHRPTPSGVSPERIRARPRRSSSPSPRTS